VAAIKRPAISGDSATILNASAGKTDRVHCEVGEQVREGAELIVFVDQ